MLDFLFSLKDKHTFFANGLDDFEAFVEIYSPEMFNANYAYLNISNDEFILKLKQEIANSSIDIINKLIEALSLYEDVSKKYLFLDFLYQEIFNYLLAHRELINISKHLNILIKGYTLELQEKVNLPIRIAYDLNITGTDFNQSEHILNICKANFQNISNIDLSLFKLFYYLNHEQYHMLIAEKINDTNCYQKDILQFAMFRTICDNLVDDFYKPNYNMNNEEIACDLYAIDAALKRMKKIDQNIDLAKCAEEIIAIQDYNDDRTVNNMVKYKHKSYDEEIFIEDKLDDLLLKYPFLNEGILTHMYKDGGQRKNFIELFHERNEFVDFYDYLEARILLKTSREELDDLLKDADLYKEMQRVLLKEINSIITDKEKLKKKKTIFNFLNYLKSQKNADSKIKQINELIAYLQLEKERINVRGL